jgi:hypothetical protein
MSGKRDASYGEVTYKVKRAIWHARRFTIADLVNLTEMGRESIESVVQRLVDEGAVKPTGENAGGGGRGRPSQYYELVDDPIRVAGLRRSIEAFEVNSGQLPPRQPVSAHYLEAVDQLTRIERAQRAPGGDEVAEIKRKLESARKFESMLERDLDVALAHIDLASGRLLVAQQDFAEAERMFKRVRVVFAHAGLAKDAWAAGQREEAAHRRWAEVKQRETTARRAALAQRLSMNLGEKDAGGLRSKAPASPLRAKWHHGKKDAPRMAPFGSSATYFRERETAMAARRGGRLHYKEVYTICMTRVNDRISNVDDSDEPTRHEKPHRREFRVE